MPRPLSWRVCVLCLLYCLLATGAEALVCTIKVPQAVVVKSGRSGEFYTPIDKKLYEEAARYCTACLVTQGTQVIITDAGFASQAAHLAVEAERTGAGPVAAVDTDPQGSLAAWWNAREAPPPSSPRWTSPACLTTYAPWHSARSSWSSSTRRRP